MSVIREINIEDIYKISLKEENITKYFTNCDVHNIILLTMISLNLYLKKNHLKLTSKKKIEITCDLAADLIDMLYKNDIINTPEQKLLKKQYNKYKKNGQLEVICENLIIAGKDLHEKKNSTNISKNHTCIIN